MESTKTVGHNRILDSRISYVTKGEVLEASKAIHDKLHKGLDDRLADVETEVVLRLGKSLDDRVNKTLEGSLERHVKTLADAYEAKALTMKQDYEARVGFLKDAYEAGMQRIEGLLQNLKMVAPTVTVNLPPDAVLVKVTQPAPQVFLPERSIHVDVAAPTIQNEIRLPDHPIQAAPVVNIEAQKPRRVQKTIAYDQSGRPTVITEEEV